MKNAVIIVAGGKGIRMGTTIPKQFLKIRGKPIIIHTIEKFLKFDPNIDLIIVINSDYKNIWKEINKQFRIPPKYKLAFGGETRFHSVKNGLDLLNEECLVGIHDAVRPLVKVNTIKKIYQHAELHGNAVPGIPVNESAREVSGSDNKIIDRSSLRFIQTPQVFLSSLLKKAYENGFQKEFTDDASVVEKSGIKIQIVDGDSYNIKITTPEDIEIAKILL